VERNPRTICYARPGDYTVRLIVSNAYGADTAVSTITVRPSPAVNVADVAEICPGAAVVLTATGADTYTWSPAHLLDTPTGSQVIARPLTTTRFTVVGTNAYGCSDTATVLVSVTTMNASGDATICKGASTMLSASGADSYAWLPTNGLSNSSVASPVASPGSTTTYVVTMRKGDCLVKDTVVVTVVDTFEVSILAHPPFVGGHNAPVDRCRRH
jgi:PKD repeat protein